MNLKKTLILGLATGLLALGGWKAFSRSREAPPAAAEVRHWVCPMRCLGKVYDHPGECPVCHMKLNPVEPKELKAGEKRLHVSPWQELDGRTAVYFRPYTVRNMQSDRILRVAGRVKGPRVMALLPEGNWKGLRPGLSVMIMPPQGYARPAFGWVESVGPGRKVALKSPRSFPGLNYALAEIRLPAEPALSVPVEALAESDGRPKVFLRQGGDYVPWPVTVTSRGESYASVSGLAEGDVVAGAGLFWLEAQWRMDHPGLQETE